MILLYAGSKKKGVHGDLGRSSIPALQHCRLPDPPTSCDTEWTSANPTVTIGSPNPRLWAVQCKVQPCFAMTSLLSHVSNASRRPVLARSRRIMCNQRVVLLCLAAAYAAWSLCILSEVCSSEVRLWHSSPANWEHEQPATLQMQLGLLQQPWCTQSWVINGKTSKVRPLLLPLPCRVKHLMKPPLNTEIVYTFQASAQKSTHQPSQPAHLKSPDNRVSWVQTQPAKSSWKP